MMDNTYTEFSDLPFTRQQMQAALTSPAGRELLALLSRDGGAALRQAAEAFRQGDTERAKQILGPVMQTEQAQALISRINEQA